jgi:ribose/galactose isomerase
MKVGIAADHCHDDFSARQGVEDDHMNILCLGGLTTGVAVAWNCVKSFLAAKFSWSGTAPSSPCQSQCHSHQSDCCLRRSDGYHRNLDATPKRHRERIETALRRQWTPKILAEISIGLKWS